MSPRSPRDFHGPGPFLPFRNAVAENPALGGSRRGPKSKDVGLSRGRGARLRREMASAFTMRSRPFKNACGPAHPQSDPGAAAILLTLRNVGARQHGGDDGRGRIFIKTVPLGKGSDQRRERLPVSLVMTAGRFAKYAAGGPGLAVGFKAGRWPFERRNNRSTGLRWMKEELGVPLAQGGSYFRFCASGMLADIEAANWNITPRDAYSAELIAIRWLGRRNAGSMRKRSGKRNE